MRTGKVVAAIVGGVAVLAVAVLLAVWLLVNPNLFKGKIAAAVKEATGRDLLLTGDIKLSVFPWVALELGAATLSNPAGFGEGTPFLSVQHAAVRVRLWPLLRERLEVSRVEIEGLDLRLARNAKGRGNWQAAAAEPEVPRKPDAEARSTAASALLESLADVRVRGGRVSYRNIVIENVDLETGSVAGQHDVPFRIGFDAHRGIADESIKVTANFDLSADAVPGQLHLAAVNLSGTLSRPGDGRPSHWDLSVPAMEVNVERQAVAAEAFSASYSSAHVTGRLSATQVFDDLSASGSVTLMPLVLHEIAPRLGVVLPKTRDPKVLSQMSGSADFSYDAMGVALERLQVKLDDTSVQGRIKLVSGEAQALQFELAADRIDVDRYREVNGGGAEVKAADVSQEEKKSFAADGTLTVAQAHAGGMDFTALKVTVASKDGITHLFPIEAQIDGGRFAGDLTFDHHGVLPTVSLDEQLTGVDMAKLLANSAQKGRVSGRANLLLKATGRGASMDAVLRSMNGHVDAGIADGAFEGVDVAFEIGRVQSLLDSHASAAPVNTRRTKFDEFKASAQISNGVAVTKDVTISSAAIKLSGEGSANLPTKVLDFRLLASILTAPATKLVDIPLRITGPYSDPSVKADINEVAKDQLKQKLQDVLKKNGLQGLFGK